MAAKTLADRKSTRLNSSDPSISYAAFCLKKKKTPLRQMCKQLRPPFPKVSIAVVVWGFFSFFFNDTAPPEISPLSLHDALPILGVLAAGCGSSHPAATRPTSTTTATVVVRSEEHTSELQSHVKLVCRLLLQ